MERGGPNDSLDVIDDAPVGKFICLAWAPETRTAHWLRRGPSLHPGTHRSGQSIAEI
jgi:hypothetical protein